MRSRRRTLALLAAAAAAVVAFVLLRGGGDGGEQVTHAQLVRRTNTICADLARANRRLEAPPKPYDDQSVPFFTGVGDNVAAAHDRLDALGPPSADADAFDRLVGLYEDVGVELERIQAAASVEQEQEIVVLIGEIEQLVPDLVAAERELGVCPGETSAASSIGAELRRTRPNPLTETGTLDG